MSRTNYAKKYYRHSFGTTLLKEKVTAVLIRPIAASVPRKSGFVILVVFSSRIRLWPGLFSVAALASATTVFHQLYQIVEMLDDVQRSSSSFR